MAVSQSTIGHEILLPRGGWDTHHHVFERKLAPKEFIASLLINLPKAKRFAYSPERHLTPPAATIKQFVDFKARLGLTHSVLTHGLSYGDDCSSLKSFVSELGSSSTMGIGVIDPETVTAQELADMRQAGIRGIRVNLYKYDAMHDVSKQKVALREHARVIRQHCPGWSMAFTHVHPEFWQELKAVIEEEVCQYGIPLVTDHFALLKGSSMLESKSVEGVRTQSGLEAIAELMRSGCLWVKISAPYRVSDLAPDYPDLEPLVKALVEANPDRVLWGSDW